MKKPRRDRILLSKATSFLFDRHCYPIILHFGSHLWGGGRGGKTRFSVVKIYSFVCQSVLNDLKVSKLY